MGVQGSGPTVSFRLFNLGQIRRPLERGLDARRARPRPPTRPARSMPSRWIPPTPRATRSTSAAPRAASGRPPDFPDDQVRRAHLDTADQLRPQCRDHHQQHRHLPRGTTTPTSRSSSRRPGATPAASRPPMLGASRLPDLPGRRRHLEHLRQHRQRLRCLHPDHGQWRPAADLLRRPRPRIRRHHGLSARGRPPALAHRPGDHLRRTQRHQRRHLAQREHRPDLDAGPRRQRHGRRPEPGQRHRPRTSDHRHRHPG